LKKKCLTLSQAGGMLNEPQNNERGWANSIKEKNLDRKEQEAQGLAFQSNSPKSTVRSVTASTR
jgi:hypothetical protein